MRFPLEFSVRLQGRYLFTVSGPAAIDFGNESNIEQLCYFSSCLEGVGADVSDRNQSGEAAF